MNDFSALTDRAAVAVLFLGTRWKCRVPFRQISPSIQMGSAAGSQIERLYHYQCDEFGEDDGDPLGYGVYALVEPTARDPHLLEYGDPYSSVDRLCNVLVILSKRPLLHTKAIASIDGFRRCRAMETIHMIGVQSDTLDSDGCAADFTDSYLDDVAAAWQTHETLWRQGKGADRFSTAQVFFCLAWRSAYLGQICLNLQVCIAGLFAPCAHPTDTNRICLNMSRYLGRTVESQARVYDVMRAFYTNYETLIHGGPPSDDSLYHIVRHAFRYTADALRLALLQPDLAGVFSSEERRGALLNSLRAD